MLYVTSAEDDSYLTAPPPGVTSFHIGKGTFRTAFFSMLDVDVLVMTMPDLETFHIKRSLNRVHYVYVQHSLVSTHMVYRNGAFDHFDTVFCAGPHHVAEIKKRESVYNLPEKRLFEAGYCRLDMIMQAMRDEAGLCTSCPVPNTVLVAPSWGSNGLLEKHGLLFVETLIESGFSVILRPHPRTIDFSSDIISEICYRFGMSESFNLDTDPNAVTSLLAAEVMVSDWSGAAMDFSFGLLRPVLFVDTPRKVNNPEYETLEIEPLEVSVRRRLGKVLSVDQISFIDRQVRGLLEDRNKYREDLLAARNELVFNPGESGRLGAQELIDILLSQST